MTLRRAALVAILLSISLLLSGPGCDSSETSTLASDARTDGASADAAGAADVLSEPDTATAPDTGSSGPTWDTDVQLIMQAYCASCHGFAQSHSSMKFRADQAYSKMQSGSMPPGCQSHGAGCPTTDELATFKAWLDGGML